MTETWELVTEEGTGYVTHRMKVKGGWVYRTVAEISFNSENGSVGVGMTFVPTTKATNK